MSQPDSVELSDDEIDSVLDSGGVGVISFADDDEPYSVPISYGYDSEGRDIYVRFGFASDSEKRRFVDDAAIASLVVTDDTGGWHSVVARGPLSKISEPAVTGNAVESIRKMNIPYVTIHEERATDLEFELYRLDPETLTGRKEQ
jgi:nitroimidazol reductase NimA-like FMN-containing flavoprotein (pyridoxamine 5'-phosphate oxidase superfamily)